MRGVSASDFRCMCRFISGHINRSSIDRTWKWIARNWAMEIEPKNIKKKKKKEEKSPSALRASVTYFWRETRVAVTVRAVYPFPQRPFAKGPDDLDERPDSQRLTYIQNETLKIIQPPRRKINAFRWTVWKLTRSWRVYKK